MYIFFQKISEKLTGCKPVLRTSVHYCRIVDISEGKSLKPIRDLKRKINQKSKIISIWKNV